MFSLEEIASNLPLSREESLSWLRNPKQKQRPYCSCLRKLEGFDDNGNVFTTSGCFNPCYDQHEILKAREDLKNEK